MPDPARTDRNFTVALDAMGGDFAPAEIVAGAQLALQQHDRLHLVLVGDEKKLLPLLGEMRNERRWTIKHAPDFVRMDESPLKTRKTKPDSSISCCMRLLAQGEVDAVISAGNSGAAVVGGIMEVGLLRGIRRPALLSNIHLSPEKNLVLLDSGANISPDAKQLMQFACMGALYSKLVHKTAQPSVALLNNGQEEYKGTRTIQAAHQLLKKTLPSYRGFIESDALLHGGVDVAVCDGFLGNVMIKALEGFADLIMKNFSHLSDNICARLEYQKWGGALLMGLQHPVYVCHGKSNREAIAATLKKAVHEAPLLLPERLGELAKAKFQQPF